jgi:YggT family protein
VGSPRIRKRQESGALLDGFPVKISATRERRTFGRVPRQNKCDKTGETPRSHFPLPPHTSEMIANNIQLINIGVSIFLAIMTFLFIFRIVLTWYPQIESQKFPFSIVVVPTEPFLAPSRKIIPPIGGVDITPIVWVAILSLVREILVGQQGLITMMTH